LVGFTFFPLTVVQTPGFEAMKERRQLKTHLRLDALVFSPKAKYICVGRDGRDCYMSLVIIIVPQTEPFMVL
jgi:aryl sulfotransferase